MRALLGVIALFLSAAPAYANPQCTTEPASKWQPKDDMMKRIVAADGYKVDVFKITTGNCYELYGRDKAGKRIEIYYHPMTGDVVKYNARK
jgi:hypothetical protein